LLAKTKKIFYPPLSQNGNIPKLGRLDYSAYRPSLLSRGSFIGVLLKCAVMGCNESVYR
jgi:hypothetical protein